jgi:hypothetical protein
VPPPIRAEPQGAFHGKAAQPPASEPEPTQNWRAIPLDSEDAKLITVFVLRASSTADTNAVANATEKALDTTHFHRVLDRNQAKLIINLDDAKVEYRSFNDQLSQYGTEKRTWTTTTRVSLQFENQNPLIDKYLQGPSIDGDADHGRTESIENVGQMICVAVFKYCDTNY